MALGEAAVAVYCVAGAVLCSFVEFFGGEDDGVIVDGGVGEAEYFGEVAHQVLENGDASASDVFGDAVTIPP